MDRMTDTEINQMARNHYDKVVLQVIRYVEKFFQNSNQTEFPTVRQVAKAMHMKQSEVWDIAESEADFMLTYYMVDHDVPIGDWFVETL